jgi:hypothetical protein
MENNTALIRWETLVDLEDLKRFLLKDTSPRKQKPTVFMIIFQGKKCID